MGKITSGGFIGEEPRNYKTQENISNEPTTEGSGEYLLRNLAKTPALAYGLARSGLGAGNIANLAARAYGASPEFLESQSKVLPTVHGGQQEFGNILQSAGVSPETSEYYSGSRQEDWPIEFGLTELPFIWRGGGFKSLANLGKSALTSAGILGGSTAGGALGGELAGAIHNTPLSKEIGSTIGALGGGVSGASLGTRVLEGVKNTPSNYFPERVLKAEESAFQSLKPSRVAEIEKELAPKIKNLTTSEKNAAFQEAIEKDLFNNKKKSRINQLHEQDVAFNKDKKSRIKTLQDEIVDYDSRINKLKEEASPSYQRAQEIELKESAPALKLQKDLVKLEQRPRSGLSPDDNKTLAEIINNIQNDLFVRKSGLTHDEAKLIEQNINSQIYSHKTSNDLKKPLQSIRESLSDFIESTGTSEHTQEYKRAKELVRERKKLESGREDFLKDRNKKISDINKEKSNLSNEIARIKEERFPEKRSLELQRQHKEIVDTLKGTQADRTNAIEAIGKETYQDLIKSKEKQAELANKLVGIMAESDPKVYPYIKYALGALASASGVYLGGIPGALGGLLVPMGARLKNEIKIARSVAKTHPEIYQSYKDLINISPTRSIKSLLPDLNVLGNYIYEKNTEKEKPIRTPSKGITSGGLI